jgi:sugar phosphate isomerase/epimerase
LDIARLEEHRDWIMESGRDVELRDAIYPRTLDGDWLPLAARVHSLLDGHTGRLGVHGPFLDISTAASDPLIRKVVVERFRMGLQLAAEVGATHMVIHSPFAALGANVFTGHYTGRRLEEQISHAQETLEDALSLAEENNCTLVMENIHDTNPEPLIRLVTSFDSRHMRLSLDTGHAFIAHQLGAPSPDHWVHQAGDLLHHIHLQDTDGNSDRHWEPGDGSINWFALFEALAELDHSPRLILEVENPIRGADLLRRAELAT